jgi:transposase-like protein
LQKWGKNKSGSVRYRCPICGKCETRKRGDISNINHQKLLDKWLFDSFHLNDFAYWRKINIKTLWRWFDELELGEVVPPIANVEGKVIILDAIQVETNLTLLIIRTVKYVLTWSFVERETSESWSQLLGNLRGCPLVVVSDGKRGLIKAVKQAFPDVKRQRCQFHVQDYIFKRLTKHPQTEAGKDLRYLTSQLTSVKTQMDATLWLRQFKRWHQTYQQFISEKTYHSIHTAGKRRYHYTHARVRTCFSHLKNSLPEIFTYLNFPTTPNTTNHLEGGINSQLRDLLKIHRGINHQKRRYLLSQYLNYHVNH